MEASSRGKKCKSCTSFQCWCCVPDSKNWCVLGTFKFITKCVVCIIIADFLKKLEPSSVIASPLHKPDSLLFSECSLQWLLNTPSITSELWGLHSFKSWLQNSFKLSMLQSYSHLEGVLGSRRHLEEILNLALHDESIEGSLHTLL